MINLENKSQLIKPDLVILFSTLEEFSGELLDDSIAPGYIKTYDNKFVRGYAFRKRWQIRKSKDKNFVYILNKLQNYSVLRMIYFRMKEDFKTLFGKTKKNILKIIENTLHVRKNK